VFFFVIHIVQVILAGWNNFRSVVSGFEIVSIDPPLVLEGVSGNEPASLVQVPIPKSMEPELPVNEGKSSFLSQTMEEFKLTSTIESPKEPNRDEEENNADPKKDLPNL
jgi:hypothetical protein